jgi:hypothetical protein
MEKAVRLKFTLGALIAANLISGCKSSATQSTEEGLAIPLRDQYRVYTAI